MDDGYAYTLRICVEEVRHFRCWNGVRWDKVSPLFRYSFSYVPNAGTFVKENPQPTRYSPIPYCNSIPVSPIDYICHNSWNRLECQSEIPETE
jgi:hypothetical protein